MKKTLLWTAAMATAIAVPTAVQGDPPTPAPLQSQVETHFRIDIDSETDTVHFVNTDNDPDIITKTYVLKNANPYELRPYLRNALGAERITGGTSKVECVKYNDGTGILLVSAEDYKFDKQYLGGGMTIDEIVETLDQPKITSSSGKGKFLYFPKHRRAQELVDLLENVGMSSSNDTQENLRGKDNAYVDDELNAIWFYVTNWSIKNIKEMLEVYDRPLPEVKVAYKIYELSSENDDKLGVDFQAWKNGPGSDIFSAASRYAHGWDFNNGVPALPFVDNTNTQFVKFSPRWNTRFIDFLAARGKASVLTGGDISIENGTTGAVTVSTNLAAFNAGAGGNANAVQIAYHRSTAAAVTRVDEDTFMVGVDNVELINASGNPISVNRTIANQDIVITRTSYEIAEGGATRTFYSMELNSKKAADGDQYFVERKRGGSDVNLGIRVSNLTLRDDIDVAFTSDNTLTIAKDDDRDTDTTNAYGFTLQLNPSICSQATTLDVNMENTSLIGFNSNGTPRTQASEVNTTVMVAGNGSKFVIGGIEKKEVVSSVSKLPWLGSMPLLGWAFSSEGEAVKKSQIVAVLDCVPVHPATPLPSFYTQEVDVIKAGSAEGRSIGYDQLFIDKDKKGLDPLP